MDKIRFLLVGAGSIGRRHLRLLSERDDTYISVAEPSDAGRDAVEKTYPGIRLYRSPEEAAASEKFDAAIIATPHTMHSEMTKAALRAGMNVFCEKPMSDSIEECVSMMKAVKESGLVFSVGYMFRFDPFVKKVKEIITEGKIGNIVHYHSRFATYNTLLCSVTRHQSHTPYSLVMDCIHDSDLLYHLTGRVPDYAFSNAYRAGDMELSSPQNVIDTVFRYEKGDMGAHIHFNYVEHPQVHTLEIVGDKGYIQGDFMEPSITVGGLDGKIEHMVMKRDFDDVYRAEWDRFIQALRGEAPPENPAEEAVFSTLLMTAERESATTGREVDIHEIASRYGFEY